MIWTTWTTRLTAVLMAASLSGCVTGYGYHTAGIDVGADYYYDDPPVSAPVYILPPSGVLGYSRPGGWYGAVGLGFGSGYGLGGYYSPWGAFGPRGHLNLRYGYGGYWRPPYLYRPPYHSLRPIRPYYPPRHHTIVTRPPKGHSRQPHAGNKRHWNRPAQTAPSRHRQDRRPYRRGTDQAIVNNYQPQTERALRPARVAARPGPSLSPPRHTPGRGYERNRPGRGMDNRRVDGSRPGAVYPARPGRVDRPSSPPHRIRTPPARSAMPGVRESPRDMAAQGPQAPSRRTQHAIPSPSRQPLSPPPRQAIRTTDSSGQRRAGMTAPRSRSSLSAAAQPRPVVAPRPAPAAPARTAAPQPRPAMQARPAPAQSRPAAHPAPAPRAHPRGGMRMHPRQR